MQIERWISLRTDGNPGTGTKADPYDGSDAAKFTALMANATKIPAETQINLFPGPFEVTISSGTFRAIALREGCILRGAGKDMTTIRLANGSAQNSSAVWRMIGNVGTLNYFSVRDLTLDTNKVNQNVHTRTAGAGPFTDGLKAILATITTAAIGTTDTTLPVVSTLGFPTSGYIWVNGERIAYNGITGTSFTGLTVPHSAIGSGAAVNAYTLSSTLAAFNSNDTGKRVSGSGITAPNTITYVSPNVVSLSEPATAGAVTFTIENTGVLYGIRAVALNADIVDVRLLDAWANPGEGFPLSVESSGTEDTINRIVFDGCDVIDPEGYLTAMGTIIPNANIDHPDTYIGYAEIRNCYVQNHLGGSCFSLVGARNQLVFNNTAYNVVTGSTIDTGTFANARWSHNRFIKVQRAINAYAGVGPYRNIAIHDNYFDQDASATTSLIAIPSAASVNAVQIHSNRLVAGSTVAPALALSSSATGYVRNNIIDEVVGTNLSRVAGLEVSGNMDSAGMGKPLGKASAANVSLDPDVSAYYANVITQGGALSSTTLAAVEELVRALKVDGLWQKMTEIYPLCGSNLASALVKLKHAPNLSAIMTNVGFVESDYVETGSTGGLKGTGATKYLNTGWAPTARGASITDFSLGVYVKDGGSGTSKAILGNCADSSARKATTLRWGSGGTVELGSIGSSTSANAGGAPGREGLLVITTDGDNTQRYYHNGSQVATASNAGTNASFTDGVANGTTIYASAAAGFNAGDVGSAITGTGIPGGTTISAWSAGSPNQVTLSNSVPTGSPLSFTIVARGSGFATDGDPAHETIFIGAFHSVASNSALSATTRYIRAAFIGQGLSSADALKLQGRLQEFQSALNRQVGAAYLRKGTVQLSNGTATVPNTNVTANTLILRDRQTDGGTIGCSYSVTRIPGASFTIISKNSAGATETADTSVIAYELIEL